MGLSRNCDENEGRKEGKKCGLPRLLLLLQRRRFFFFLGEKSPDGRAAIPLARLDRAIHSRWFGFFKVRGLDARVDVLRFLCWF